MKLTRIRLRDTIVLKIIGTQNSDESERILELAGAKPTFLSGGISCGSFKYDVYDWEALTAWEESYPALKIDIKDFIKYRLINTERDIDYIHTAILLKGGSATKSDLIKIVPLNWPTIKLRIAIMRKRKPLTIEWQKKQPQAEYKIISEAFRDDVIHGNAGKSQE